KSGLCQAQKDSACLVSRTFPRVGRIRFQGCCMFVPLSPFEADLTIYFQGRAIPAQRGDSVAAALLRAGIARFRTSPVSGAPRLPFCMIGHCFECLVDIDDVPDQQACLRQVAEGMRIAPSEKRGEE